MEIQRYSIKLDMQNVGPVDTGIRLKQGDSGMILDFYVYSGGQLWKDSSDKPEVVIHKPDGNVVYDYASLNGNAYSYTILGEELTAAGTAKADVKFQLDNGRESTRTFTFYIEPDTLTDGAYQSKSYISPVEQAVADAVATVSETYLPQIKEYTETSKSYAVGGAESTTHPNDNTDNAKYYCENAQKSESVVEAGVRRMEEIEAFVVEKMAGAAFELNFDTGELMYESYSSYVFSIDLNTGDLMYEIA